MFIIVSIMNSKSTLMKRQSSAYCGILLAEGQIVNRRQALQQARGFSHQTMVNRNLACIEIDRACESSLMPTMCRVYFQPFILALHCGQEHYRIES